MPHTPDTLVIGGGVIGRSAAWHLARRGAAPLLIEQYAPAHHRGASHGTTRNLNNAYEETFYVDLYAQALTEWHDLERTTGAELLGLHGLVTHGDTDLVGAAREALRDRAARVDTLSSHEAADRWPGMRFSGDVLFSRDAGVVFADRALAALDTAITAAGGSLQFGTRIERLEPHPDGATVVLAGPAGESTRLSARRVVVAAGAWSAQLLGDHIDLPPLTVTEEHPAHFASRDDGLRWPSFNHLLPAASDDVRGGNVYGMPSPGEGVKVGFHRVGEVVDPDARPFRATDAQRTALRTYVADWFPGLDPDSADEISCTYTSTDSGRFVLDRVGALTVAAGFSGHGFKFAPRIGRLLADAALDGAPTPAEFRLSAHERPDETPPG